MEISTKHRQRFDEIKKQLTIIGHKEANFIKVELLFYEAMEIAREYGNEVEENTLLANLKSLQANQYQTTKDHFKKSSQREQVIKRFVNQLKIILSAAIKNLYVKEVT